MIKSIFWNEDEHRVRALWRQILQVALWFILWQGLSILAAKLIGPFIQVQNGRPTNILGYFPFGPAIIAAASLLSVWIMARFINREPFKLFGFRFTRNWWVDCGFGLLLGLVLTTLVFLVELLAGWVTITRTFFSGVAGVPFFPLILISLLTFIGAAFNEEPFFRGYPIRNLAQGIKGSRVSPQVAIVLIWLLSSVAFGLFHSGNPHAVLRGLVNIGLAGILFGLSYVLTGSLGLSIGIHIAWDFTQGSFFGTPVAGTTPNAIVSLIAVAQHGPALWTGGAFGTDGGLLVTLAFLLGLLPVLLYVRLRYGKIRIYTPLTEYTPRVSGASDEKEAEA
jgi:membrane protease YdiL (CAAX protease family)